MKYQIYRHITSLKARPKITIVIDLLFSEQFSVCSIDLRPSTKLAEKLSFLVLLKVWLTHDFSYKQAIIPSIKM